MRNHFITSYRFLKKSKTYTFINLSGLVLGLTAAFLLLITTINQLTYNRSIPKSDRLYRVLSHDMKRQITEATAPIVLASLFSENNTVVEKVGIAVGLENFGFPIMTKGEMQEDVKMICANAELIDILGIRFIKSSPHRILNDTNGIVISEKAARRFFGSGEAIGRDLLLKINGESISLKVEAVYHEMDWNSTLATEFIGSMKLFARILPSAGSDPISSFNDLTMSDAEILVRLHAPDEYISLLRQSAKINSLPEIRSQHLRFLFQPMSEVFLNSSEIVNDLMRKGKRDDLNVYLSLAIFILVLAGVNYSILSTARSALRFREIGVRKVLGATHANLRGQILTESILLTLLAFPISLLILGLLLPWLEPYFGHEIRMYKENMVIYLILFPAITILIGILSGVYVAFYLAALDPLEALKSKFFSNKRFSLSKLFIVFQLFITLALLIAVINVYRQINHCLTQNAPDHEENLLMINFNPGEFFAYSELKAQIMKLPGVISVSGASINPPTTAVLIKRFTIPGNPPRKVGLELTYIDYDFFKTMNIRMIEGKELRNEEDTVTTGVIYLNQAAAMKINLPIPIGSMIGQFKIKGIVEDYNFHTLHTQINPSLFVLSPAYCQTLIIRLQKDLQSEVVQGSREVWKQLSPNQAMDYRFYDDQLAEIYHREKNFGRVIGAFTLLAFIITGMGLFGLAMLISERRMKEMAIRKIFGASNPDIVFQMQKEFYIYLGFAAILAIPLTWYLMELWLYQFYYRVQLHWITVAASILVVALFVSTTLLLRTIKVIKENPIVALKYE